MTNFTLVMAFSFSLGQTQDHEPDTSDLAELNSLSPYLCVLLMRIVNPQEAHMNKRATNLTIDPVLLDEARSLNINMSSTFEASLREAVRKEKAAQWLEENRAALDGYNDWIEKNGLPLEKYRQF